MKTFRLIAMTLSALALAACSPPEHLAEPDPPPVPTPNPAVAARTRAITLYPDLAKKDSQLNLAFVEIYNKQKEDNPTSLTTVDWPIQIARQAADMLGVREFVPTPSPTPLPAAPPAQTWFEKKIKEGNSLEKGPHDQKRSVYPNGDTYDSNGRYYIDQTGRHYY